MCIIVVTYSYVPDQECTADELVRVSRPGGTIGVISWTPTGFFGRMLATIRPYRPALSAAVAPAALWGREDYAVGLLGGRVTNVRMRRDMLTVDSSDNAAEVHHYFKNHYGPTIEGFANIGANAVLAAALDVQLIELAAGSGNVSLHAALVGAHVIASDLTPELRHRAQARAAAEGLELGWREADTEALPFEANEFDTVLSAIGVMFAPRHQRAADELTRVCRRRGTIGLISWTPRGSTARCFRPSGGTGPPCLPERPTRCGGDARTT
jgi:hypothetical protein